MKQDKAIPSIGVKDEFKIEPIEVRINSDGLIKIVAHSTGRLIATATKQNEAEAMCTAVNLTYGLDYNPAAMEELYKALELFTELHETGNWPGTDDLLTAKTALNNAKTK